MKQIKALRNIFPLHLQKLLEAVYSLDVSLQEKREPGVGCEAAAVSAENLEEIRMRAGSPLLLSYRRGERFWDAASGTLTACMEAGYRVSSTDIQEVVTRMSNYSLYAFEEEVRGGFLTIAGGHRVGIAGHVVCETGNVRTIRPISSLNIRIAKEKKGCADAVLPKIRRRSAICNTLIISAPGVGKTTLLRDCIRQLSYGTKEQPGLRVGVVDERSELASCYMGQPQNDLGPRTDVLDGCPKPEGMRLLLRSMSPQVLAVDELGSMADYEAVEYALHCGCCLIGTMHGESLEELKKKPHLFRWLNEGFFERYVFLQKQADGTRSVQIYDERQCLIYDEAQPKSKDERQQGIC